MTNIASNCFFSLLAKASSLLGSGWHYLALQSFHSVAFLLMFAALDTQPATIYVGRKMSYLIFLTVTVSTINVFQLPLASRNGAYWCILYNVMVFHVFFRSRLYVEPYYVRFVLRIPEVSSRIRSLGFSWNPGLSVDGMIEGLEVSSQHHQTSQNIHHRENLSSGQGNNATSQDLPKEITLF